MRVFRLMLKMLTYLPFATLVWLLAGATRPANAQSDTLAVQRKLLNTVAVSIEPPRGLLMTS